MRSPAIENRARRNFLQQLVATDELSNSRQHPRGMNTASVLVVVLVELTQEKAPRPMHNLLAKPSPANLERASRREIWLVRIGPHVLDDVLAEVLEQLRVEHLLHLPEEFVSTRRLDAPLIDFIEGHIHLVQALPVACDHMHDFFEN